MKNKIREIKKRLEEALRDPNFAFGVVQGIISEIEGLPFQERNQCIEIYKQIGQFGIRIL